MVWYKSKRTPKLEITHISSKMSLIMVRMAWYDKNILVYESSILKLTIFLNTKLLTTRNIHFWPLSINQLTGQRSHGNVGLYQSRGNPHDPICWKSSKMAHPFAWKVWKKSFSGFFEFSRFPFSWKYQFIDPVWLWILILCAWNTFLTFLETKNML